MELPGAANEEATTKDNTETQTTLAAQESTKAYPSEASLQSVEATQADQADKAEKAEKTVIRKKKSKEFEKRRPSIEKKELALHSLGGAALRAGSKDKLVKTSHRAAILLATANFPDTESESSSDSDDEGFGSSKAKKTRLGRLRAGKDYIIGILQKYSIPLVFGVFLALVWSNVHEESYLELVHWTPIKEFKLDGHSVDFHFVINDFFMCFFFGLAIKEVTEALLPGGSLSPLSRAANPLLATLGGVVGPAATYAVVTVIFYSTGLLDQPMCLPEDFSLNATDHEDDHHRRLGGGAGGGLSPSYYTAKCSLEAILKGWGVPTATDISLAWMFAILIFGPGHAAINFLLLLAILDDALGMIIIAVFYPDPANPVDPIWLLLVLAAMVVAFGLRKLKVSRWQAYILIAAPLSWAGLFKAHVHPALSLVFVVPFMPATHAIAAKGPRDLGRVDTMSETSSRELVSTQSRRSSASRRTSVSSALEEVAIIASKSFKNMFYNEENAPLHVFEHTLKVLVDFGMFFFGLLNAGVKLNSIGGVTACVGLALVVGKIIGIAGMSLLGSCIGAPLPKGLSVPDLVATSALGGIGLTVALFVANEAFVQPEMRGQAKMGAVLSILCGLIAFVINRIFSKGKDPVEPKTPIIGITVRHVDADDSQAFGRLFDVGKSEEVKSFPKSETSDNSGGGESPTSFEGRMEAGIEAAGLPNTVEEVSQAPGTVLA